MIFEKNDYTVTAQKVLRRAVDIAYNYDYQFVGSAHILAALLGVAGTMVDDMLKEAGADYEAVIERIADYSSENIFNKIDMDFTPRAKRMLDEAKKLAAANHLETVGTEFLLCALLSDRNSSAMTMLNALGVNTLDLFRQVSKENNIHIPVKARNKAVTPFSQRGRRGDRNAKSTSKTPTLDSVAIDMTAAAREGKYDPTIGRDEEINRVMHVLSRRSKNNPVLVGDPGVGKTAIVEGLAQAIITGNVPQNLVNVRLMALNMANVIAGTSLRGEFEDRMMAIIKEVSDDADTILFIDELHTIIGAGGGSESTNDASNILKPALARGDFQMIGATTYKEYQRYIEKDEALERRLARITVDEPTEDEALAILQGLKPKFEAFHDLVISDAALAKTVEASVRYMPAKRLPDKAIDLLDEACARVKISEKVSGSKVIALEKEAAVLREEMPELLSNYDIKRARAANKKLEDLTAKIAKATKPSAVKKTVEVTDVIAVVSALTGIPVQQMTKSESERLIKLEKELHKRVIGQDEAVSSVARAIRRSRSGVSDSGRPIGSFMFLGPTGVGKTELAKALADGVFGSEDALIRVDMSEYMEKFSTSRLIGAPPGYVGFDEGGQLTERVRNHPYSVVLLDEVEKAHPDVFNILLQILDDGFVSDTKGRKVDFRNTIIIMTSNLGATALRDEKTVGFAAQDISQNYEAMKSRIMEELKLHYRPEFLNRIDESIVFHNLSEDDLVQIVKLMVRQLTERLEQQSISLKVSPSALKVLARHGFDPEYGARPLRKAIERDLEDPISERLLKEENKSGSTITVGVSGDNLKLS